MSSPNKNRIIIIDPSPVVQQGLKKMLEENAEFTVNGMYCDIQLCRNKQENKPVDIILINPAVVSFYRQFAVRDLFPEYLDAIFVAIHYGYVNSDTLADFDGVLNIYDDNPKIQKKLQQITQTFVHSSGNMADNNIELSEREKEILVSVAKGLTNKEIADKHYISVHTVISHRKNITRKTGIKTVSGLTVYAVFNNFVSQDDLL
jgi:DNA-binding NarL/FixJ family response regulator